MSMPRSIEVRQKRLKLTWRGDLFALGNRRIAIFEGKAVRFGFSLLARRCREGMIAFSTPIRSNPLRRSIEMLQERVKLIWHCVWEGFRW